MTSPSRLRSRRVFVDTSAYYALADPRDGNHRAAIAVELRLASGGFRHFTTNFILAETHALLLTRAGRATAQRVLGEMERSATVVVRVNSRDEQRARAILGTYDDKDFSLTDATSFAVIERLRIGLAFTFDGHFVQFGFSVATSERGS